MKGAYRAIGVNRTDFLGIIQMRPDAEEDSRAIEWVAFASNVFNTAAPFYTDVENFYWASRMIAAMADASYSKSIFHIERYQERVMSKGHEYINQYDELLSKESDAEKRMQLRQEANEKIADMVKKETQDTLNKVLYELSNQMKNAYSRSDA